MLRNIQLLFKVFFSDTKAGQRFCIAGLNSEHRYLSDRPTTILGVRTKNQAVLQAQMQNSELNFIIPNKSTPRANHATVFPDYEKPQTETFSCFLFQIGALCHDLGHGPFSHLFEGVTNAMTKADKKSVSHEQLSKKILRSIFKNRIPDKFKEHELDEEDMEFICQMFERTDEFEVLVCISYSIM